MLKISLHQLIFHGYHGLYKEERSTGNEFEVNLDVYFQENSDRIVNLQDTINYGSLYDLVKARMELPEPLLETLAMDIAQKVKDRYPFIVEINVSVSKLILPLLNFQGKTGVTYYKKY